MKRYIDFIGGSLWNDEPDKPRVAGSGTDVVADELVSSDSLSGGGCGASAAVVKQSNLSLIRRPESVRPALLRLLAGCGYLLLYQVAAYFFSDSGLLDDSFNVSETPFILNFVRYFDGF